MLSQVMFKILISKITIWPARPQKGHAAENLSPWQHTLKQNAQIQNMHIQNTHKQNTHKLKAMQVRGS